MMMSFCNYLKKKKFNCNALLCAKQRFSSAEQLFSQNFNHSVNFSNHSALFFMRNDLNGQCGIIETLSQKSQKYELRENERSAINLKVVEYNKTINTCISKINR